MQSDWKFCQYTGALLEDKKGFRNTWSEPSHMKPAGYICLLLHTVRILEHTNRSYSVATTPVVADLTQLIDEVFELLIAGVRWHLIDRIRDPGSIVVHASLSQGKKQNKWLVESSLKFAQRHKHR